MIKTINFKKINYEKKKVMKNGFKIIRNISAISLIVSAIGTGAYSLYIHKKLAQIKFDDNNIEKIVNEYKNNEEILILSLNDSQGINLNVCFWENSFSKYVTDSLGEKAVLINCASNKFNKTNHIDKLLESDISYAEFKALNIEGSKVLFSKVAKDIKSPIDFGFAGTIFCDKINDIDYELDIATSLKENQKPIVFYFSGANDLMRQLNCSPVSIRKYNKSGSISEQYLYASAKATDPKTLDIIMNGIESNFNNIYALNNNARVYALSIYTPPLLENEDMKPFTDIILGFNERLKKICDQYKITYVSTETLGKVYNNATQSNFHITEIGHKVLADEVINIMADDISVERYYNPNFELQKLNGLDYISEELTNDALNTSFESWLNFDSKYLEYVRKSKEKEILGEAEIAGRAKQLVKYN